MTMPEAQQSRPVLVRMAEPLITALDERARFLTKKGGVYYTRSEVVRMALYQYLNLKPRRAK